MKRVLCLFLTLVLLVGMVPVAAYAEEPQTEVQNDNFTIQGTNGLGTLLSEDIQEQQESDAEAAKDYEAGYGITALDIQGKTATVTYGSLEAATLVVSLYTEDGLQLLNSAKTEVTAEDTEATVTFTGEMPQYFYASAFLLDSYDLSPLCPSYDTPMYTQEMQELLASTVEDYDEDKVLNLDEDKTTNFAVFGEETIVIEKKTNVNIVASADEDTHTYVIENADEQITDLQEGDIFAYPYGDNEMLIVKVASIQIIGTTVTITGAEVETEEVFSHVKISENDSSDKMLYEEGSAGEGVTYLGLEDKSADEEPATYSLRRDTEQTLEAKYTHKFAFAKSVDQKDNGIDKFTLTIEGTLDFSATVKLSYYVSPSRQFIEFRTDAALEAALKVNAKLTSTVFELGSLGFMIVPGVYVGFNPQIIFEINAAVETSISVSTTVGFSYENETGFQNLCTAPVTKYTTKIEGSMMIGFDLCPKIGILCDMVQAGLEAMIGLTVTGKMTGTDYEHIDTSKDTASSHHLCGKCLDGDVKAKLKVGVWAEFLKWEELRVSATFLEKEWNLFDFYYSLDHNELAGGECPYYEYRLTLVVNNTMGFPAEGAAIVTDTGESWGTTNANGITVKYVPAGSYNIITTIGDKTVKNTIAVTEGTKIIIAPDKKATVSSDAGVGLDTTEYFKYLASVSEEEIADYGNVTASGQCGENCSWVLYESGLLRISGTGDMYDYDRYCNPWYTYNYNINKVEIEYGVTNIDNDAFVFCHMTSITIPRSVTSIGDHAFAECSRLTNINIPDGVNSIGDGAFMSCGKLTSVTIPASVTKISSGMFLYCYDLTSVTISEGVTSIESSAFSSCRSLSGIVIPDSVTSIGNQAFIDCYGLTSITIPKGVTSVGTQAFFGCSGLTSITIPEGVTSIGNNVFGDCKNLTRIDVISSNEYFSSDAQGALYNKNKTELKLVPGAVVNFNVPTSVASIDHYAFAHCYDLTSITIPNSVTSIGNYAFWECESLTDIMLPNSVTSIGDYAFLGCNDLTSITIPEGVTSIGDYVFADCGNLSSVTIPNSVTSIGDAAFLRCYDLTNITIPNSVMSIGDRVFEACSRLSDIYYGGSREQWKNIAIGKNNDRLQKATIHFSGETVSTSAQMTAVVVDTDSVIEETEENIREESKVKSRTYVNTVFGGQYETEEWDSYTLKRASFKSLVPGEQYVLLAMVSLEATDALSSDNLLYIAQNVAEEDGTLVFEYVQRTPMEISYVVACGASNKNLKDAQITFPPMTADEEIQAVNPVVVYEGKTLTEGIDYVLLGKTDYTEAGEYTCTIRGIRNYTGVVECQYTVVEDGILGDLNGDESVNDDDVILLLWHTLLPDMYPIQGEADFNSDNSVNDEDVIYLLWHTLLPDLYPL